jgi:hypothetical protein
VGHFHLALAAPLAAVLLIAHTEHREGMGMPEVSWDNWLDLVRTAVSRPFTAGNLTDYGVCPRKFLLSHFAAPDQQRALGRTRALHSALRAALVAADKMGGPAKVSLEWLRNEFLRCFDGSACSDSLEEEQTRRLGLRMLAQFHASQRETTCELIGADVRFQHAIEDIEFVAVADRVERHPEMGLIVARYDSRREPLGPQRLMRDRAMGLLVLVAEAHHKERPVARVYALHKGKTYDAVLDDAVIARVRQHVLVVARTIRADTHFQAIPGANCGWCRVRNNCSAWQERRQNLLESGGS